MNFQSPIVFFFISIFISTLIFLPISYLFLKKFGVAKNLFYRSFQFGMTIIAIQYLALVAFQFPNNVYIYYAISVFTVVLSFLYIRHVLTIKLYQTVLVIILVKIFLSLTKWLVFGIIFYAGVLINGW